MFNWQKLLIGIGAVGAFFGGRYLLRLKKLKDQLILEKKGMVYQMNTSGIIFRFDVTVTNYSNIGATISRPLVKISYKGKSLAFSIMKDSPQKKKGDEAEKLQKEVQKDFEIPIEDKDTMPPIYIQAGYLDIGSSVPGMITDYLTTGKVAVTVEMEYKIDGWYTKKDTQQMVLGGKKEESVNGLRLWGW